MNTYSHSRTHFFLSRLLAGLLLVAWLAPAAHGDGWPYWPFNKEEKPGKPDKIIAMWSDTILTQTGRPPIRGVGGRLMFYEGKKDEPIKVEGTLMVYAFDETDREPNNTRPDRKYAFTPQQLPLHYSKSKVGHSYSVWLPWDEVGGLQKEITLIVRFQPKEGPVAIGDPCRQLLPGRIVKTEARSPASGVVVAPGLTHGVGNWGNGVAATPMANGGVQPASYQAPLTEGGGTPSVQGQPGHMTTTTIELPPDSLIRSAITTPQPGPAAGYRQPEAAPGGPGPNPPWQNQNYPPRTYPQNYRPPQNYQPQYVPPPAPTSASQGLQLRSGFPPGRQWPLGEPLARLNRDRAPSPPPPAGSPSGLGSPPGPAPSNAGPAGPPNVPQSSN